jgi:hypothetical protein
VARPGLSTRPRRGRVINWRARCLPDRPPHGNEPDPPLPRRPRAALHGAQGVPLTTRPAANG